MGKTFKDTANHFKHHLSHGADDENYANKNKLKYTEKDIPENVKDMVKTLEFSYKANRYGNNRNMHAETKVTIRRLERKKEDRQFQKELKDN